MSNTAKWIVGLIVVALVVIGVVSTSGNSDSDAESESVKIGAVLPLTGNAAQDGEEARNAIDLAVSDIESERDVNVEVSYHDDETNPKESVTAMRRLEQAGVDAAIGGIWSFLAEATLPLSKQTKTVTISPSTNQEYVSGTSSYFFLAGGANSQKAEPLTKFLKQHGHKTAAIIVSQDGWGRTNKVAFKQAVENVNGEVVVSEEVAADAETDTLPSVLAKVRNKKPDVILWTGYGPGAVTLIKRVREQEIDAPIVGATVQISSVIKDGKVDAGDVPVYLLDYAPAKEFERRYKQEYGSLPEASYSHRSYDATHILVNSILETDSPEDLKESVRNTDYNGYGGSYGFDDTGGLETKTNWMVQEIN